MKISLVLLGTLMLAGCAAPPPDVPVPVGITPPPSAYYPGDIPKPLPDQTLRVPVPAFNDPPLIDQTLPEQAWFADVYNHVGHPHIAVYVNRTLDGALIGEANIPMSTVEIVKKSTGAMTVDHSQSGGYGDWYHGEHQSGAEHFQSNGPAEYHETATVWLHPGQFDENQLGLLDYTQIESITSDWFTCGGKVTVLSPGWIRGKLTAAQAADLQEGRVAVLQPLLDATADVLVQIQAHAARRNGQLVLLVVAEAINVKGGESLGHVSLELPAPLDRYEINNATRYMVRKLMQDMIGAWTQGPENPAPGNQPPGVMPPPPSGPTPTPQPSPAPAPTPLPPALQPTTMPAPDSIR